MSENATATAAENTAQPTENESANEVQELENQTENELEQNTEEDGEAKHKAASREARYRQRAREAETKATELEEKMKVMEAETLKKQTEAIANHYDLPITLLEGAATIEEREKWAQALDEELWYRGTAKERKTYPDQCRMPEDVVKVIKPGTLEEMLKSLKALQDWKNNWSAIGYKTQMGYTPGNSPTPQNRWKNAFRSR